MICILINPSKPICCGWRPFDWPIACWLGGFCAFFSRKSPIKRDQGRTRVGFDRIGREPISLRLTLRSAFASLPMMSFFSVVSSVALDCSHDWMRQAASIRPNLKRGSQWQRRCYYDWCKYLPLLLLMIGGGLYVAIVAFRSGEWTSLRLVWCVMIGHRNEWPV